MMRVLTQKHGKVSIYDVDNYLFDDKTVCRLLDHISDSIKSGDEYQKALYKVIYAMPNGTLMMASPSVMADEIAKYIKGLGK